MITRREVEREGTDPKIGGFGFIDLSSLVIHLKIQHMSNLYAKA